MLSYYEWLNESDQYGIHPKFGCPKEYITCPGCGKVYNGNVCLNCEECGKCCQCKDKNLVNANNVKEFIGQHGTFPKHNEIK